jgi:hypothetical protein
MNKVFVAVNNDADGNGDLAMVLGVFTSGYAANDAIKEYCAASGVEVEAFVVQQHAFDGDIGTDLSAFVTTKSAHFADGRHCLHVVGVAASACKSADDTRVLEYIMDNIDDILDDVA